jgi:hypothetical protein
MSGVPVKKLSEGISTPVLRAYKAGGYGLAFLTMGCLFLVIAAVFLNEWPRYLLASAGTVLIAPVLVLFYLQDIKKLGDLHRGIKGKKNMIDTVQTTAIEMTELASNLQAFAFKHANEVAEVMTSISKYVAITTEVRDNLKDILHNPLLSKVPGVTQLKKIVDSEEIDIAKDKMALARDLSQSIVTTTKASKQVIADIKRALIESNPEALKRYNVYIHKFNNDTTALLQK